jgi:galactokinase
VTGEAWAPGRVNLIGEHIDYYGLPVLPMATRQRIRVRFQRRGDRRIRAVSEAAFGGLAGGSACPTSYGAREFEWSERLEPVAAGDWENYLRAAAQAVAGRWGTGYGVDAEIDSDLPAAAGLSSSSALIVAFTLCLLRANSKQASFEELMDVLPEGEHFVGTCGGGMDHAASLGSREGCASLIRFAPVSVRHIPIPRDWGFLLAHSLETAEKSGPARDAYNAVRAAGDMTHANSEARRVEEAVEAMERGDAARFGRLLCESHASLRDRLHVSTPALDRLVATAMESGALGARLTGAGFGGCAVVFAKRADLAQVRRGLIDRFYAGRPAFLIEAEAGPGALES